MGAQIRIVGLSFCRISSAVWLQIGLELSSTILLMLMCFMICVTAGPIGIDSLILILWFSSCFWICSLVTQFIDNLVCSPAVNFHGASGNSFLLVPVVLVVGAAPAGHVLSLCGGCVGCGWLSCVSCLLMLYVL